MNMVRPSLPPGGTVEVLGKVNPAKPEDWPATFIFVGDGGGCTSTAVGERVIMTAAHCIADHGKATVATAVKSVVVTCSRHPSYLQGNKTSDFALCVADQPFEGIPFERISTA